MESEKIYLGDYLVEKKIITQEQLDIALIEQKRTNKKLGEILVEFKFIEQNTLLQLIANQLHLPFIDLKNYSVNQEIIHLLTEADARRLHAIVLNKDENGLLIGMIDPNDVLAFDELERILQQSLRIAIVSPKDLERAFDINYRRELEISHLSQELSVEMGESEYDVSQLSVGLTVADAPVVKLLQSIFEDAAQIGASDVHIEPDESLLRLRLRIDGVLHEQILQQKNVSDALALRLKLMAGLNIAEKRLPQDGRFSIKIMNKKFDVRLSTLPSQYGESVVMRLLNQSAELLSLTQMGMPKNILKEVRKVMMSSYGLLLITGPTGSGKTTTLYGMLSELNKPDVKIITVEDPVEYRLGRITQVQVHSAINLTFSTILRSILRQDPDIIMIGELRDQETAEIALRSAMTGHFVFSTLHTNDAISSAERLIDMGVESYLVSAVLKTVIAQRLVRRICPNCIEDHLLTPQDESWLASIATFTSTGVNFKQGRGCSYCYQTGYKGQIAIFEFLLLTRPLLEAIRLKQTSEFRQLAYQSPGFQTLVTSGLQLAAQGITTLTEVMQVTGEISPHANV